MNTKNNLRYKISSEKIETAFNYNKDKKIKK